jgi:hypothetical protein
VFGHAGRVRDEAIQHIALDLPGPVDLSTFYAAHSHYAEYVFNMVL